MDLRDVLSDALKASAQRLPPTVYPTWMAYEIAKHLQATQVDGRRFKLVEISGSANWQPVVVAMRDETTGQLYELSIVTKDAPKPAGEPL